MKGKSKATVIKNQSSTDKVNEKEEQAQNQWSLSKIIFDKSTIISEYLGGHSKPIWSNFTAVRNHSINVQSQSRHIQSYFKTACVVS